MANERSAGDDADSDCDWRSVAPGMLFRWTVTGSEGTGPLKECTGRRMLSLLLTQAEWTYG